MGKFLNELILTPLPNGKEWIVRRVFAYVVTNEYLHERIVVPAGFITDLASIPRALWWLYPPFGKYTPAVVIHDWLYWVQLPSYPRLLADKIMFEAMLVCGEKKGIANNFYFAVHYFGQKVWDDNAKQDKATGFVRELPNSVIIVPRLDFTPY